jgi:hypothetical protein
MDKTTSCWTCCAEWSCFGGGFDWYAGGGECSSGCLCWEYVEAASASYCWGTLFLLLALFISAYCKYILKEMNFLRKNCFVGHIFGFGHSGENTDFWKQLQLL